MIYIMVLCWWDVTKIQWWLRSTTSSYRRLVLEVAYGETIIHSTETVWEILTRKEWLGCRHDTSPMVDILGSTLVWTQYMVFFDFTNIKVYMYYVLKIYSIMKEILVVSNVVLLDNVQRTFSTAHDVFNLKWKSTDLILFLFE